MLLPHINKHINVSHSLHIIAKWSDNKSICANQIIRDTNIKSLVPESLTQRYCERYIVSNGD